MYGSGDVPLDGWAGRDPEFFRKLRDGGTIPLAEGAGALLHPGHVADLARSFGHVLECPGGPHALMMRDYIRLVARIMGVEAGLELTTQQEILPRFPALTSQRGLSFACRHMCCDVYQGP
ncbi:unnamed protein product [marine sediment metagenome]|uniref:Uncharacterized protein n=1 Tax=marine sediment metagenome TaxID=412755 RepID=X0VI71_9ZZZZ